MEAPEKWPKMYNADGNMALNLRACSKHAPEYDRSCVNCLDNWYQAHLLEFYVHKGTAEATMNTLELLLTRVQRELEVEKELYRIAQDALKVADAQVARLKKDLATALRL